MKKTYVILSLVLLCTHAHGQSKAVSFRSSDGNYWKMETVDVADRVIGTPQVIIRTANPRQTFKGWGTCFNELPWDAYNLLSETQRTLFAKRLFNPNGDLRLTVGRIPIGASDYARDWYSCDEFEGDFDMQHFNIDRDLTTIIPSIRVAQAENPDLTFWASPWSPPQWMKTNKHYAQRRTSTNGCPFDVPPYVNNQFIDSAAYYQAYSLYFSKFVQAYKAKNIPITALAYQNEAYSNTPYPGCSWTAAATAKFLGQYLGPYFSRHHPDVKLILGTMNTGSLDVYEQILNTPGVKDYVSQIGFQWEGGRQIHEVMARHPDMEAVQTESECGSGTFDWKAAEHTFQLINHYLANRVTTYTYWNAILKDKGTSSWGWVQNALVQVNSSTNTPNYTAEYYALKHYSHLIPPGSRILTVDESRLVLSAETPSGLIVVVAGNSDTFTKTITIDADGRYLAATLPAKSFTSYVLGDDEPMRRLLASEARGLVEIESGSLSVAQTDALTHALSQNENNSPDALDALISAVSQAETGTGNHQNNTLRNPSFTNGSMGWTIDNVSSGGDFRSNTIAGKTCWNNWSDNFTSMNIYQDLSGLTPGAYRLSCLSMCGPNEITDQHAFMIAQGDTTLSPVKRVAIWNTDEGWEQQTTEPVVVGTDGTLRVGYASTSGGGTKGWFCVTDFALSKISDDSTIVVQALQACINRAKATGDGQLATLITEAERAGNTSARLDFLTLLRDAITAAPIPILDLTAYETAKTAALTVADTEDYSDDARANLRALVQAQADIITTLRVQASVDDLTRQLQQRTDDVRKTRKPGLDTDFSFLIVNPDADSADGWALSNTNGDALIKSGQHYSGDTTNPYFDSYNATRGNLWYTGRQTVTGLPNGTYRLIARGRTDGSGVYVFALADSLHLTAVPVEGNTTTSGSLGRGWNEITVDNITVSDNTMTIGFSNDSYFTGKPRFSGTWFSIDDFQLYYLSASAPTTIHTINTLAPQSHTTYYTASGMKVERAEGHGLFIVRRNNAVVKILR